jgi:hypothetical protein
VQEFKHEKSKMRGVAYNCRPTRYRYEAVNAMLLNEFLKEDGRMQEQARKLAEQDTRITEQQKQIEALTAGLQKVTGRAERRRSGVEFPHSRGPGRSFVGRP